ncbi:MAG: YdiU family protein [Panacagrimonas sp.]|nr:protein adenylyltransferase SelO [Panacagrimonas sp.]MCC2657296.1 YdiU family protein [Panacagrimonas sp.]
MSASSLQNLDWVDHLARLPAAYYSKVMPEPLSAPRMAHFNAPLAARIGLPANAANDPDVLALMAGNAVRPGVDPLATVYAGHQFGTFVPQLGDGRAMWLGQIRNADGELFELQLKGAGHTPYSRFADGRAVLRSIGHFEFFYYQQRHDMLAPLADHLISLHFPQFADRAPQDRYAAWLGEVVERTARLIAQWQGVGFCHGVMNTDNMSTLGLTIDYGPYGFLDGFQSGHICNHSDEAGRYAYDQQPRIGYWNSAKLLQATLPLLHEEPEKAVEIAQAILARYPDAYADAALGGWRGKLGLQQAREGDRDLANLFLNILDRGRNDFTRCFRGLAAVRSDAGAPPPAVRDEITDVAAFDAWLVSYRERLRSETSDDAARAARMNAVNPKYVLRNHLVQTAIEQAEHGIDGEVARLFDILQRPFDEQPENEAYAAQPPAWAQEISVSCSS